MGPADCFEEYLLASEMIKNIMYIFVPQNFQKKNHAIYVPAD